MPLAGFSARALGGAAVAALREKSGDTGAVSRFHERTAEQYTELLGQSKGVLMKAGQILSMIDATSFGSGQLSPYQVALTRLQADAPPMDPDVAKEVLRADLRQPLEQVFAEFSDMPIAAASIGQVHRASLHDGRKVAVKIQYPGAAQAIRDDLSNTEFLATLIRLASLASGTSQPDVQRAVRVVASRIAEEVNYQHEAANIAMFRALYHDHPFIEVPEVIREASGGRVLTMTFLEGLDWTSAQGADQALKNIWSEVIQRFSFGSYRHSNLFQADPHPGNYRFGRDGKVGFVDFGCVILLPEHQRRQLIDMPRAAMDGRCDLLRQLMVEAGFFADDSTVTSDEAYRWWAQILYEALAPQPVTYSKDTTRRAVRSLIDVRSGDHIVRRMAIPDHLVFSTRISLNLNTIFARFGATLPVRAISDDLDGVALPSTDLGKEHHSWRRARGLPCGLDHHGRT
ncbi:ABC transporter [Mycobacterium sp. 852002-40037_SCH5390672]|nr:ABC transporter [Mycobacterium sp. 852002-40037_SCH5390672]